jgi:hypothetical protein
VDAVVNGEFSLHAEGFYVTEGQAVIILLGRCGYDKMARTAASPSES